MRAFKLKIFSADRTFYEGDCQSIIVPAVDGQYGVQAGHSNTITAIVPGKLVVRAPGEEPAEAAISSGIMKIENGEVLIMCESVLRPEEIDEERAKREAEDAKEALLQKMSRQEYLTAQAQLARALNKLRIKQSYIRGGHTVK